MKVNPPHNPPQMEGYPPHDAPPVEIILPETPQKTLDAALARINQGYQAGCTVALEAERPELWASIQAHRTAVDQAVLSGGHAPAQAAIQGLEYAWAEAKAWYRARCAEAEAEAA